MFYLLPPIGTKIVSNTSGTKIKKMFKMPVGLLLLQIIPSPENFHCMHNYARILIMLHVCIPYPGA